MKITGKHLINMGYKQGKWFRAALDYANAERLTGEDLISYLVSKVILKVNVLELFSMVKY